MSRKAIISILLILYGVPSIAQMMAGIEEFKIRTAELREDINYLAGEETAGRAFGTAGHQHAAFYITKRFESAGLLPISGAMSLSFKHVDKKAGTLVGHNILGMTESGNPKTDRYLLIGAYYDGIGTLKGKLYPGADANASGVAALIQLARSLRNLRNEGHIFPFNIIFVAFDGRRCDWSGSKAFWNAMKSGTLTNPVNGRVISPENVELMMDLDQLGSSLAPVDKKRRDYFIFIGEDSLPQKWQGLINLANNINGYSMDLNKSYYGSSRFTDSFYKSGDRKIFIQNNIPVLFCTSGITELTNSTEDNPQNIDFPSLRRRTIVIFRFIKQLMYSYE